jgi:hypothetical protein
MAYGSVTRVEVAVGYGELAGDRRDVAKGCKVCDVTLCLAPRAE